MKGYYTDNGYYGYVDGEYMLFETKKLIMNIWRKSNEYKPKP